MACTMMNNWKKPECQSVGNQVRELVLDNCKSNDGKIEGFPSQSREQDPSGMNGGG